jgi:hypothetical protein
VIIAILFIVVAQASWLTDDVRALLRSLARAHGCMTPSISAQSRDGGMLEITVACPPPGEDP